jgi:hypothetical protein
MTKGLSVSDRWLVPGFALGTVGVRLLDDGRRFREFLPGLLAVLMPVGLGIVLASVVIQSRSHKARRAAIAFIAVCLVASVLVERQATIANDAFVQMKNGIPVDSVPFLRSASANESQLSPSVDTFSRVDPGEMRSYIWQDWSGNAYAIHIDAKTDHIVYSYQGCFGPGVFGVKALNPILFGFVLGIVSIYLERLLAWRRRIPKEQRV